MSLCLTIETLTHALRKLGGEPDKLNPEKVKDVARTTFKALGLSYAGGQNVSAYSLGRYEACRSLTTVSMVCFGYGWLSLCFA
jgi:hypothetical protein